MGADNQVRDSPRYDAFAFSLWRDGPTGPYLRVEVEHVRTGALARVAAMPTTCGRRQFLAQLTDTREPRHDHR